MQYYRLARRYGQEHRETAIAKEIDIIERIQQAINRVREFSEGKDNDYGTATAVIREAKEALEEARTAGVRVTDLRSQLPELEQKAKRFYADKAVGRVREIGEGRSSGYITPDSAIKDAWKAITEARLAGANVLDLESEMPEIEEKAWHCAARKKA